MVGVLSGRHQPPHACTTSNRKVIGHLEPRTVIAQQCIDDILVLKKDQSEVRSVTAFMAVLPERAGFVVGANIILTPVTEWPGWVKE